MDYWIGLPGTEPDHMALEISFGQSPGKTWLLTSPVGQSIKQQRDTKTSQTATYWLLRGTEQQKSHNTDENANSFKETQNVCSQSNTIKSTETKINHQQAFSLVLLLYSTDAGFQDESAQKFILS